MTESRQTLSIDTYFIFVYLQRVYLLHPTGRMKTFVHTHHISSATLRLNCAVKTPVASE